MKCSFQGLWLRPNVRRFGMFGYGGVQMYLKDKDTVRPRRGGGGGEHQVPHILQAKQQSRTREKDGCNFVCSPQHGNW